MKWRLPRQSCTYKTAVEIDGVEHEVMVLYREYPAEPDVGVDAGCEIEGVYFEDQGDIQAELTEDQLNDLAMQIGESNDSAWEAAQEDRYDD